MSAATFATMVSSSLKTSASMGDVSQDTLPTNTEDASELAPLLLSLAQPVSSSSTQDACLTVEMDSSLIISARSVSPAQQTVLLASVHHSV